MTTAQWTPQQLKDHFGDREFSGTDIGKYLNLSDMRASGAIIKSLKSRQHIEKTINGYRFRGSTPAHVEPTQPGGTSGHLIKINGYFIAEHAILLVDTLQGGKATIYTTILEIDGETKHPRNKKLIFTQQHAPDEYAAVMAWLRANADTPQATDANDIQAALQLVDESAARLAEAHKEIESLKAKIAQFRALLGDT